MTQMDQGTDGVIVGTFRLAAGVAGLATLIAGIAAANAMEPAGHDAALAWCLIFLMAAVFTGLGAVAYNIPRHVGRALASPALSWGHLASILALAILQAAVHAANPDPAGMPQGFATLVSVYLQMGWLCALGANLAMSVLSPRPTG